MSEKTNESYPIMSATHEIDLLDNMTLEGQSRDEKRPTPKRKNTFFKRGLHLLVGLIFVVCLIYFLFPHGARLFLVHELEKAGMQEVYVDPISWKPWIPSFQVGNIRWQTPNKEQVSVNSAAITFSWANVFERHLKIQDGAIKGLELPIDLTKGFVVGGLGHKEMPKSQAQSDSQAAPGWDLSIIKARIVDSSISLVGAPVPDSLFRSQEHIISIEALTLEGFSDREPLQKSQLFFKGALNDLPVTLNGVGAPLSKNQTANAELLMETDALWSKAKQWLIPELATAFESTSQFSAKLALDHQNTQAGRVLGLSLRLASPDFKASLTRGLQEPLAISLTNVALDVGLSLQLRQQTFSITSNSFIQGDTLTLEGENLAGSSGQFSLRANLLETEGQLSALEQTSVNLESQTSVKDFTLSTKNTKVVAFDSFDMKASVQDKQVNAPRVAFTALKVPTTPESSAQELLLKDLVFGRNELGERALSIGEVTLTDLAGGVLITQGGQLQAQNMLSGLRSNVADATLPISQENLELQQRTLSALAAIRWQVDLFKLQGENNFITILDQRDEAIASQKLVFEKLELQRVGMDQATEVVLGAKFDQGGSIAARGQITLADFRANTDLKATVTDASLAPLSPYLAPILGYAPQAGRLNGELLITTQAGEGTGSIKLNAFNSDLADAKGQTFLSTAHSLPLPTAFALLTSDENKLSLDIPLAFAPSTKSDNVRAIQEAILLATHNSATNYLAQALAPYGDLTVDQSENTLNDFQLLNIPFDTMSSTLRPAQTNPALKIAALLQSKPSLKIRLCPSASKTEIANWPKESSTDETAALETLALQRAQSLKRFFKEKNISDNRIFICTPVTSSKDIGEVRVSL